MPRYDYIAAILVTLLACPAWADKPFAVTPSGANEVLFTSPANIAAAKLSSKCIDVHWTVIGSSQNEVVCEAPLNLGQSVLGQLALGNSYSTPPRRFFRFNLTELNGITRVQASGWIELQMAFGQIKRSDFVDVAFHNDIINFMGQAGGILPAGTTFPNHVVMGVKVEDAKIASGTGLRVTGVEVGSAAERAGILSGDVITSIAHKKFKNSGQYFDATAKAAETPNYDVEIIRNGEAISLKLERQFRPAVIEVAAPMSALRSDSPVSSQASVADELTKLVKLKEQGVLTSDEFEKLKQKLVARN